MSYTQEELIQIQQDAVANLNWRAQELRVLLLGGVVHVRQWESTTYGERTKVGRGWLCLTHPDKYPAGENAYPGVHYTSSMGANSDDSYGGFLPGVTFEEAKLLVYGDFKRFTR